jgi:phosphomannomutase
LVKREGRNLSQLVGDLPPRFTVSGLLRDFAPERSQVILSRFETGDEQRDRTALEAVLGPVCGGVVEVNRTDGIRVSFDRGDIVHLRPSGNAPEFRCYTEADTEDRAREINRLCLLRILDA